MQQVPPKSGVRHLTRRAALTFVSKILQHGARLATQFLVTPLLIQHLGMPLYGAWMIIQQTIGYLALGDIRPMSTLKFALSVRQHIDDDEEKRRLVGAALSLTLYTLPVLLLLGGVITWLAPHFIHLAPEHASALRITMAIAVASFILDRLLTLPSNVLIGMNLDYRSMGMSAASVVVSGALMIGAVQAGYGLPGVAIAVALGTILYSVGRYFVARRAVPWFGASRPTRSEVKEFAKMSGGISLIGFGHLVMSATDVLLIGMVLGPAVAGMYAVTGAVLRFGAVPFTEALGSGGVGIADLCGRKEWARVTRIRAEMHLVAIAAMSIVGFVILVLNRHFLLIWTKRDVYAGSDVNLMLVLLTLCGLLYKTDRAIATALFELRIQTIALVAGGTVALGLGAVGTMWFGPAALPAALTCAYAFELIVVGRVIRRWTGARAAEQRRLLARPLLVALLLFGAGLLLERRVAPDGWLELIGYGVLLTVAASPVVLWLGLGARARAMLGGRLRSTVAALRQRTAKA
ncbi:MAG TPA: hypothetical protein VF911_14685 [Thermoanaerobaculia bacterium]